jgi:polysaccharide export outer membrane protein
MAPGLGDLRRLLAGLLAVAGLTASGCMNSHPFHQPTVLPVAGAVPRELEKVTLPEYVIEPPDVLQIGVYQYTPPDPNRPKPPVKPKDGAKEGDEELTYSGELRALPVMPINGQYTVRTDGTLFLGYYGTVPVAGYTLRQAAEAIRQTVAPQVNKEEGGTRPENIIVILDVIQYASKKYYVIFDNGAGADQVYAYPVTGSETVLDALANNFGLTTVSSKRNIWVARRTPHMGQHEQILPVDWVGITQHGVTATNYQVFPGDRIYVKAQRLVTLDTTLSRLLNPVERLFGITLLGASTVNQIQGRGLGFGNN